VVVAGVATAALPDTSVVRVGASAGHAASSIDRPAAGASAPTPGTCSSATSAALGEGAQAPTSQGACPLSLSSSSPSPDDEYFEVAGEESPCCSRSRYSSSCCSQRSRCWILLSFLRAALSCSRRCAVRVAARAQGVGGSDRAASTVTLC
jgi:hypothetical protein